MNLFSFIGVSVLSYLGSIGIIFCGMLNMIMIFPKKGYIINPDKLDEHRNKIESVKVSTKEAVMLSIPILNLLFSYYFSNKLAKTIFKEFESCPGYLLSMTDEEKKEFKKCKNALKKLEYYMELMDSVTKSDIVDAEYYEVINDDEEKKDEENSSIIDEYKKLRNEVDEVNSNINNYVETDEYVLGRRK